MWPNKTGLDTTHLDAGSDNPGTARLTLLKVVQALVGVIDNRGQPEGICELDDKAKVPAGRIDKGVAGGVCELGSDGKVPTERYDAAKVGSGLARDKDNNIVHGKTSAENSFTLPPGHYIHSLQIDEYGHITAINSAQSLTVEREATTSRCSPNTRHGYNYRPPDPPDPPVPPVGLPGTWKVLVNQVTTSSSGGGVVTDDEELLVATTAGVCPSSGEWSMPVYDMSRWHLVAGAS